jgi:hypothetical protein
LASCGLLSIFVPLSVWLTAAGLILAGLLWRLTTSFSGSNRDRD